MKQILVSLGGFAFTCASLQAIVFDLDFTGATGAYDPVLNSLVISASNVATGEGAPNIDVVIESITPYFPDTEQKGHDKNGSALDDIKIHMNVGSMTRYRLSVYEGGTMNLYAPGEDYSYDFVVYDIDGDTGAKGGADEVIFYDAMTYSLGPSPSVTVTNYGDSISFLGTGGEITGQEGLSSFTPEQENASIQVEFTNTSQFEFAYSIPHNNDPSASGRNMLWDAQDLDVTGTPQDFTPVPEPSHYGFITAIVVGVAVFGRRK